MSYSSPTIVCDLDGTLAESKSALTPSMAETIVSVLNHHRFVIVSGGGFPQFKEQLIDHMHATPEQFQNFYLFPEIGSACFMFDIDTGDWKEVYNYILPKEKKDTIIKAIQETVDTLGIDVMHEYGDIIEDRGAQVSFSGCGQHAPVSVKQAWDPDHQKRQKMIAILIEKIPEFEIKMGGMTTIDITQKGRDKAFAIEKIKEILHTTGKDMIFFGDAMYEGGNDEAVKKTDVPWVSVTSPSHTQELLRQYTV